MFWSAVTYQCYFIGYSFIPHHKMLGELCVRVASKHCICREKLLELRTLHHKQALFQGSYLRLAQISFCRPHACSKSVGLPLGTVTSFYMYLLKGIKYWILFTQAVEWFVFFSAGHHQITYKSNSNGCVTSYCPKLVKLRSVSC